MLSQETRPELFSVYTGSSYLQWLHMDCHGLVRKSLDFAVMTTRAESRISHGLLVVIFLLIDQGADVASVLIVFVSHMIMDMTHS
jgi:hypothetical protein